MKAIKVTAEHKENNPTLFKYNQVGDIIKFDPPNQFVRSITIEGKEVKMKTVGFNFNEAIQAKDGVKVVKLPTYDHETQKLGKLIEMGDEYTYEVLQLTEEELDNLIPKSLSKLAFKTRLLDRHGITDATVDPIIEGVEDETTKARLKLMWYQADIIERKNPYLYEFAPALELTKADIVNLFKDDSYDG